MCKSTHSVAAANVIHAWRTISADVGDCSRISKVLVDAYADGTAFHSNVFHYNLPRVASGAVSTGSVDLK